MGGNVYKLAVHQHPEPFKDWGIVGLGFRSVVPFVGLGLFCFHLSRPRP